MARARAVAWARRWFSARCGSAASRPPRERSGELGGHLLRLERLLGEERQLVVDHLREAAGDEQPALAAGGLVDPQQSCPSLARRARCVRIPISPS